MSSDNIGIIKFKTSDFIIQTCSCHYSIWKKIRDKNDETWKFDEIESGKKSFRKLFHQKMTFLLKNEFFITVIVVLRKLL